MPRKKTEPHFIEKPVPSTEELRGFERRIRQEGRGEDINSRLSEIYRDDRGRLIDVKKLERRARRQAIITIFRWLLGLSLVGLAIWAGSLVMSPIRKADLDLTISAPDKVKAGEDFSYQVICRNNSGAPFKSLKLEVTYPDNFIFTSADEAPVSGNNSWTLPDLPAGGEKVLTINGKIINQENSANNIRAKLTYSQANFSTEISKEATAATLVSALGFSADVDYPSAALSGAENNLSLKLNNFDTPLLGQFKIEVVVPDGVSIIDPSADQIASSSGWSLAKVDNYWQLTGLNASSTALEIPFHFKVNNFSQNRLEIIVRLSYQGTDGKQLVFFEKRADMDVIKNDLNLALTINGNQGDQAVNFGDTLNYVVSYTNQGAVSLNNITVSAVADSPFIDWSTLAAASNGNLKDSVVTWTKNEVPALAEIKPGQAGSLGFSVRLKKFSSTDLGNSFQVKSYAQFNIDDNAVSGTTNRSNVINSNLNSDLSFAEKILYFDENNSPVGDGPLPPKVGEKTSVRVYWTLNNTLHDLDKVKVVFPLSPDTSFGGSVNVQAGTIYYDQAANQVVWDLGRIPVSVPVVKGSFNLSLTPAPGDQNKILVISAGSKVTALDSENNSPISLTSAPKTTKLEDDDIAALSNSGRVQ